MTLTRTTILTALAIVTFCIGFYPAIADLVHKWSKSDEYTHAFLAVPIIGFMIWRKKALLDGTGHRGTYFGLSVLILTIPLYVISLQLQVPTITSLIMMTVIVGALIFLGGIRIVKELAIPLLLLVLLIPIPNQIYSMITLPLQLKVSQISEVVVQMFGIPIFREGNVLYTPTKIFQIVEACSGMRSLITLMTLSLIMAYFTLQRGVLKLTLLAASLPVAFGVNILRVVVLVVAYHFFSIDLTQGTNHTVMGMVVFVLALAALFITQRILEKWELRKTSS